MSRRSLIGMASLPVMTGGTLRQVAAREPKTDQDASPQVPLVPWIFLRAPLEKWMADYRRTFDAWADGGVRGIAIGYMEFLQPDGSTIPSFPADPKVYESFGVAPPTWDAAPGSLPAGENRVARDREKERRLQAMLDDAARRGWQILMFLRPLRRASEPPSEDPFSAASFGASVQDMMNAYPQARGVIIDGVGGRTYELEFPQRRNLFQIDDLEKPQFAALGIDIGRLERGAAHLDARFHQLTPSLVRYYSPAGVLAGLALFDLDEDALYWLRKRQEASLAYMAALRKQIDRLNRKIEMGTIPRAPVFSLLSSQDYQKMHPYFDYIFPKHYFWLRGYDGLYGTVARWVRTIHEWNPSLSETDCFAVAEAWFGIALPGIRSLADMELGFPEEFFSKVVYSETRRALEAVGDPNKVIAWVQTGQRPHGGDPMTEGDLHHILTASQRAGLRRFIYHPVYGHDLSAGEWSVISTLCGKRWNEDPSGYWPGDTWNPTTPFKP
jgi:hypothetical protein